MLLLSYDVMKPMKPEINQAIADWVKAGGVLVYFGGGDAYDALPEWWHKGNCHSPMTDLLWRMELPSAEVRRLRFVDDTGSTLTGPDGYQIHGDVGKGMVICGVAAAIALRIISGRRRAATGHRRASLQDSGPEIHRAAPPRHPARGLRRRAHVRASRSSSRAHTSTSSTPSYSIVKDPTIPPDTCALYKDVTKQLTGAPKLLYSSSKVEKKVETAQSD